MMTTPGILNRFWAQLALLSITFLPFATPAAAVPMSFDVFAQANSSTGGSGLDTGISLTLGDVFTVTVAVDDLWNAGNLPRWSNADGLVTDLFSTGTDDSGVLPAGTKIGQPFSDWTQNGLTAPFGSLVGSLGGTFFVLGTSFNGPAPATGNLLLYYWDQNNGDNTEFVTALVNSPPGQAPTPGTLALLGTALAVLASRKRRR